MLRFPTYLLREAIKRISTKYHKVVVAKNIARLTLLVMLIHIKIHILYKAEDVSQGANCSLDKIYSFEEYSHARSFVNQFSA